MQSERSTRHRTKSCAANGFTLVEVLVAIVILGLCVTVLTNSISDSLVRAQRVETEDHAAARADAILAELGRNALLTPGVTQGVDGNFYWRLVVTPAPKYQGSVPVDEIDLTMFTLSHHLIGDWRTLRIARP